MATYNPVTYVLGALRSLIAGAWQTRSLVEGLAAITATGVVSVSLSLGALRGRIRRGA